MCVTCGLTVCQPPDNGSVEVGGWRNFATSLRSASLRTMNRRIGEAAAWRLIQKQNVTGKNKSWRIHAWLYGCVVISHTGFEDVQGEGSKTQAQLTSNMRDCCMYINRITWASDSFFKKVNHWLYSFKVMWAVLCATQPMPRGWNKQDNQAMPNRPHSLMNDREAWYGIGWEEGVPQCTDTRGCSVL